MDNHFPDPRVPATVLGFRNISFLGDGTANILLIPVGFLVMGQTSISSNLMWD